MKFICSFLAILFLISNPAHSQDIEVPGNIAVALIYGGEKKSLFDWQYLNGTNLLKLWSPGGFNSHKVYVNQRRDGKLEWRVSGWISSFDGGVCQHSCRPDLRSLI